MRYRAEIDGLRAVAILPIVAFHADIPGVSGGFVGVDVFYVISGFLITAILRTEQAEGRFTFAGFYRRRAVRILPALLVMVLATLGMATGFLFPAEIRQVAVSAMSVVSFTANLYFSSATGYFSEDALFLPLLHGWSLGIEEQFYLLYPIVLLALVGRSERVVQLALAAIVGVSFWVSFVASTTPDGANFAFYALPSRAWELGVGALIAFNPQVREVPRWPRQVLAGLGVALIVVAILRMPPRDGFPAPFGLVPCLGTAAILLFGEGTVVGSTLSLRPLRYIGRISYSLYLWHWPIITFYRLLAGPVLTATDQIVLLAASLAAAMASYHLVERPAVRRLAPVSDLRILAGSAGAMAVVLLLAAMTCLGASAFRSNRPDAVRVAAFSQYYQGAAFRQQFRAGECFVEPGQVYDKARCIPGGNRPMLLLMGDSVAAQLWSGVNRRFGGTQPIGQLTASTCRPLLGVNGPGDCAALMRWGFDSVIGQHRVARVVFAGLWQESDLPSLMRTIRFVRDKGVRVTVLGPPVQYRHLLPTVAAHAQLRGDLASVDRDRMVDTVAFGDRMAGAVRRAGAEYVDIAAVVCPATPCAPLDEHGDPIVFDRYHLTPLQAARVVSTLPD